MILNITVIYYFVLNSLYVSIGICIMTPAELIKNMIRYEYVCCFCISTSIIKHEKIKLYITSIIKHKKDKIRYVIYLLKHNFSLI